MNRAKSKHLSLANVLILDFIRNQNGKGFPFSKCALETGLHYNTVQRRIPELIAQGKLKTVGYKAYEVVES